MTTNFLSQNISPSCLTRIIRFAAPKDLCSASSSVADNEEQQFVRQFKRFFQLCSRVTSSWQNSIDELFSIRSQDETKHFIQNFFGAAAKSKTDSGSGSTLFRKIFEMIALNPLNFTRTAIFRRQILQIAISTSFSNEVQEEKLFQRLKLPLQLRQTSSDDKHGALAIGKDVFIYCLPTHQVMKNSSSSSLSVEFKELGSVKPRAASSLTNNNFSDLLQLQEQPPEKTNSTSKLFCAYRSCFSPDSRLLAVSCLDGTIRFGESKTGQLRATLSILNGNNETSSTCDKNNERFFIEALCFSQDNRYLYFCANSTVYVAKVFDDEGYLEPIIVNSWKGFSTASSSSSVRDYNQYVNSGFTFYINNMRLNQNFLLTCDGDDCSIAVYDVANENCESPKLLKRIGTSSVVAAVDKNETWVRDIAILNHNGHTSFFTVTNDRMLACYEVNEDKEMNVNNKNGSSGITFRESRTRTPFLTNHTSKIFAIAIADAEGRQEKNNILATASNDGDVRIFDIENWKEKREMILKGDGVGLLTCLAFTPSLHQHRSRQNNSKNKQSKPEDSQNYGAFYLVTGSHLNEAKIWSLSPSRNESQCFKIISFKSSVLSIAMSPNGENLVFTDYYGARRFFAVVVSESVINNNNNNNSTNRSGKSTKQFEGVSKYPVIRMHFVKNTIQPENNDENFDDEDDDEKLFVEDLMGNAFIL